MTTIEIIQRFDENNYYESNVAISDEKEAYYTSYAVAWEHVMRIVRSHSQTRLKITTHWPEKTDVTISTFTQRVELSKTYQKETTDAK